MPVQMIESEEVEMMEVSDEALEAMKAEVVGVFSTSQSGGGFTTC
jgi:hypothetical protein